MGSTTCMQQQPDRQHQRCVPACSSCQHAVAATAAAAQWAAQRAAAATAAAPTLCASVQQLPACGGSNCGSSPMGSPACSSSNCSSPNVVCQRAAAASMRWQQLRQQPNGQPSVQQQPPQQPQRCVPAGSSNCSSSPMGRPACSSSPPSAAPMLCASVQQQPHGQPSVQQQHTFGSPNVVGQRAAAAPWAAQRAAAAHLRQPQCCVPACSSSPMGSPACSSSNCGSNVVCQHAAATTAAAPQVPIVQHERHRMGSIVALKEVSQRAARLALAVEWPACWLPMCSGEQHNVQRSCCPPQANVHKSCQLRNSSSKLLPIPNQTSPKLNLGFLGLPQKFSNRSRHVLVIFHFCPFSL